MEMKPESVSPRGAVEKSSAAPRVRSLSGFGKTKVGKTLTFLAGLGVAVAIARWASEDTAPPASDTTPVSPLQVENLKSFIVRKDGKKYWEIAASQVELSPGNDMTTAKNVKKGILYRDEKPFLNMNSPSVRLSNQTNNLVAIGGVSVKGPNGFSFSTPQTLWIQRTQTVECPKPVSVKLRGMTFTSPQLFYNWKEGVLSCPKPVEVQATGAKLKAAQMQANVHTRVLELKGGAEFVFDPKIARPEQFRALLKP
jgi:LPS export ABC transporter protein LptC